MSVGDVKRPSAAFSWVWLVVRWVRDAWCVLGIAALLFWGLNGLAASRGSLQGVEQLIESSAFREASGISDESVFAELAIETDATHDSPFVATRFRWEPLAYWRSKPHAGKWINVDAQGLRRTIQARSSRAEENEEVKVPVRIFCFGGSTMWGSCVRDEATIPSQLAGLLAAEGLPVEVTNFGQMGYVSTQERITLEQELARDNKPDLVVLYDGFNDIGAAMANREPGLPADEFERPAREWLWRDPTLSRLGGHYLRSTALARLFQPSWHAQLAQHMQEQLEDQSTHIIASNCISRYFSNVRMILALARPFKFDAQFYWQPLLTNRTNTTDSERELLKNEPNAVAYHRMFDRMMREQSLQMLEIAPKISSWRNLAHMFDSQSWRDQTLYFDLCHLADIGNRAVAAEMARDLIPLVQQRLAAQSGASSSPKP